VSTLLLEFYRGSGSDLRIYTHICKDIIDSKGPLSTPQFLTRGGILFILLANYCGTGSTEIRNRSEHIQRCK
jgi:hypothetical protein